MVFLITTLKKLSSFLAFSFILFQIAICQQCDQVDSHGVEVCWDNVREISTPDGKGIYECGSNSEDCVPGARSQYSLFKSLNNEEEFYIFGGEGYDSNGNNGLSNDLWKGTISSDGKMIYSFIDGSSNNDVNIFSENGTLNQYSTDNIIGQRRSSGSFRTDNNLCIFGGYGNPNLNSGAINQGSLGDFYCYGINEKKWKFLGGFTNTNSDQFYKGNDWPGQRFDSNTWSYQNGNGDWFFFLFGGMTNNYLEDFYSSLYDFWRYDVSKGQWLLMIDTTIFSKIYRTTTYDNIYDNFNRLARPPVTAGAITFQNGNSLFMFGGSANNEENKLYNDLWEYSIAKEMWRHVSGSKVLDNVAQANYEGPSQIPGGRKFGTGDIYENAFYLFGGIGEDSEGIVGILKDTWKYNFITYEWSYMDILPIGDSINPKLRNGNGRYKSDEETGNPEYFYPRMGIQSTIIDRKIYFFGGKNTVENFQDTWNLLIEYECYGFTMSDSEVCNFNGACVGTDSCSCNLGYYGDQCEKKIEEGIDNSETNTDELVVIPITLIAINIVLTIICLIIIGGLIIFVLFRTGKFKQLYSKSPKEENFEVEEESTKEESEKQTKKSKKRKNKKKKAKEEKEESFGVARLSFL